MRHPEVSTTLPPMTFTVPPCHPSDGVIWLVGRQMPTERSGRAAVRLWRGSAASGRH